MKEKVKIHSQLLAKNDQETETIEENFDGFIIKRDGKCLLTYEEHNNKGQTQWIISEDAADLRRYGMVKSHMEFAQGLTQRSKYSTPYGILDMEVETSHFSFATDGKSGILKAKYSISIDGKPVSENSLQLDFNICSD